MPPPFGRESFAVTCPLALGGRRLVCGFCSSPRGFLPASFSASLTAGRLSPLLRLAVLSGSLRPTRPEDFHLLFMPMLGTHEAPRSKLRGILRHSPKPLPSFAKAMEGSPRLHPRSSLLRRSSHFSYEGRKLRGIRRKRIKRWSLDARSGDHTSRHVEC